MSAFESTCQYCGYTFANKYGLSKHVKRKNCKGLKEHDTRELITNLIKEVVKCNDTNIIGQMGQLEKQIAELKETQVTKKEIDDLKIDIKENPRISNQILQVICVGQNDNYLDMLTQQWGDFDKALEYIKDCALSNLSGDCKLIGKMYLSGDNVRFADKSRTKISYFNENKEKIIDSKELFGKKIANNLQNSYLKGVNYLINRNLDNNRCPNKFLEEYDLQTWNQHIYNLSDLQYQKKLISQLDIPEK